MDRFLHRTKKILFTKQTDIFSSALLLSVMIIISRVFGFFRYRILAGYFTTQELDIYFAAFRIPDLIFEILITGALISSLIPIYIRYQKDKEDLSNTISSIANLITLIMLLAIAVVVIFMDRLIPIITPGFDPQKIEQVIWYSRILLVGQLPFLITGNFLTGIAQANKSFLLPAIAPVVYNIAIIAVTVISGSTAGLIAPVLGVVLGGFLFLLVQLPVFFMADFSYRFVIRKTKGLVEFFRVIVPRLVTIIVAQIDATIDLTLTSLLGSGSYTVFYLAQHLQLLPVSVVGIATGQASLPYLSELYNENKMQELGKTIVDTILNLFYLTIPVTSFFIFARTPIVRLFFGGDRFDWDATVLTAITLSFFALSLPFHTIYYFLTRCFYAVLDTKTPFAVSVVSIIINTVLSLYFVLVAKLPVWALAISFSVAMISNVLLLIVLLYRKITHIDLYALFKETIKMVIATLLASIVMYYLTRFLDELILDTARAINVFFLDAIAFIGLFLLYFFLSWILDIKELYIITKLLFKAKEYHRKIVEFYAGYE